MQRIYLVAIATAFLFSCNTQTKNTVAKPVAEAPAIEGNFNYASGIKFDSSSIQKFLDDKPSFKEFRKDFQAFYGGNQYNYVWYDKNGLIESAGILVSDAANVATEGVNPDIPYLDSLESLLESNSESKNELAPDLNTELMLTGIYFSYAKKIWAGSLNTKTDSLEWFLPKKKLSYATLLADNLKNDSIGETKGPVVAVQYQGLKKELTHYRDIDSKGGEVFVPLLKKPGIVRPNTSSPEVVLIRRRLMQLGDVIDADTSAVFDSKLAAVISDIKGRYGLKKDSLITNAFITEINVPAKKRVEQIMVNMERLRWIPPRDSSSHEFILVNIPEYNLHYYEEGKDVWQCNVVVGKPMTKTVIFSGKMQYVVFSPYWNVPPSIINKEIKPAMKRNPNYLASHNMEWNGGRVRQKPGPRNSLGLVKFLFPNSNNIYLHDTPSKSLFTEDKRAFSHGCIRVAKPKDLAMRLLRNYPEWTSEKIDAAMRAGTERTVTLKPTIPVYIGYFTAFLDNDGQLNFRSDVYNRDGSLLNMLMQQ
ncbi:MAG TPA: L,D-transpeptidase family protein [Parafilimonas sp.]|nr:L,D-transpeptidase family protein [Parafilimonas sp.]